MQRQPGVLQFSRSVGTSVGTEVAGTDGISGSGGTSATCEVTDGVLQVWAASPEETHVLAFGYSLAGTSAEQQAVTRFSALLAATGALACKHTDVQVEYLPSAASPSTAASREEASNEAASHEAASHEAAHQGALNELARLRADVADFWGLSGAEGPQCWVEPGQGPRAVAALVLSVELRPVWRTRGRLVTLPYLRHHPTNGEVCTLRNPT